MARESETIQYDRFKALLGKVLAVPREEILKREAEYQRASQQKSVRPGPKPKRRSAGRASAVAPQA